MYLVWCGFVRSTDTNTNTNTHTNTNTTTEVDEDYFVLHFYNLVCRQKHSLYHFRNQEFSGLAEEEIREGKEEGEKESASESADAEEAMEEVVEEDA